MARPSSNAAPRAFQSPSSALSCLSRHHAARPSRTISLVNFALPRRFRQEVCAGSLAWRKEKETAGGNPWARAAGQRLGQLPGGDFRSLSQLRRRKPGHACESSAKVGSITDGVDLIRRDPILLNPLTTNSNQRARADELRWTDLQVPRPSSSRRCAFPYVESWHALMVRVEKISLQQFFNAAGNERLRQVIDVRTDLQSRDVGGASQNKLHRRGAVDAQGQSGNIRRQRNQSRDAS